MPGQRGRARGRLDGDIQDCPALHIVSHRPQPLHRPGSTYGPLWMSTEIAANGQTCTQLGRACAFLDGSHDLRDAEAGNAVDERAGGLTGLEGVGSSRGSTSTAPRCCGGRRRWRGTGRGPDDVRDQAEGAGPFRDVPPHLPS